MMAVKGKSQAVKHNGYTDGVYDYYADGATWYAIEPLTGLSVAAAPTRKEVAERAHGLTEKVQERIHNMSAAVTRFAECKERSSKV